MTFTDEIIIEVEKLLNSNLLKISTIDFPNRHRITLDCMNLKCVDCALNDESIKCYASDFVEYMMKMYIHPEWFI